MLEPTNEQRQKLQAIDGPIEIIQFLAVKDMDAFDMYLDAANRLINAAGGAHLHSLHIDQILSGIVEGETPYSVITIDHFPDSSRVLQAFDGLMAERSAALSELYTLVLRKDPRMTFVKRLRFLAPLLHLRFRIENAREINAQIKLSHPERSATVETLKIFETFDQNIPFYNMNLNKHFPVPAGEQISIDDYYADFSKKISRAAGLRVLSIGAYPAIAGEILSVFVGDEHSKLHDDWHNFQLVYYPTREHYIRLISHLPDELAQQRNLAYERAIQMPCSTIVR